ncbi:hypothetical protein [Pseudomonas sp. BR20]|uniref:hypothetical protein n=1 Tax=Pseudomonas sp. BR20 TaxID=3137452 RepID=UPI003D6E25F9
MQHIELRATVQAGGYASEIMGVVGSVIAVKTDQNGVLDAAELPFRFDIGIAAQGSSTLTAITVLPCKDAGIGGIVDSRCGRLSLQVFPLHIGLGVTQLVIKREVLVEVVGEFVPQRRHLAIHVVVARLADKVVAADLEGAVTHTFDQLVPALT